VNKLVIQFVAADPFEKAPLRVDREYQRIQQKVQRSIDLPHELPAAPAATISDVIFALQRNQPNCVHFSCHGTTLSQIVLLNSNGQAEPLSHQTIGYLFSALRGRIRLVTLSSCYSVEQAQKIADIVDCVIGIHGTVDIGAAAAYFAALYGQLAQNKDVAEAHTVALIEFSSCNSGDPPPVLLPRAGVEPSSVRPGEDLSGVSIAVPPVAASASATLQPPAMPPVRRSGQFHLAKRAFEQDRQKYGVWADELIVVKSATIDGTGLVTYRVRGLRTNGHFIRKLHFTLSSEAGLVANPRLDPGRGAPELAWKTSSIKPPKTIQKAIDRLRCTRGFFEGVLSFEALTSRPRKSYSFGWTVPILNCDAVTEWEYENLYSPSETHIDKSPITNLEYFAVLIWFPVKKVTLQLNLPDLSEFGPGHKFLPRARFFQLRESPLSRIPRKDVLVGGSLFLGPRSNSAWSKRRLHWDAVQPDSSSETPVLESRSDGSATLSLEYPSMGSWASIDWDVVVLEPRGRADTLIRRAEELRRQLLRHREFRRKRLFNIRTKTISSIFLDLHTRLWERFDAARGDARFETTLLVWNAQERHLEMVEGFVNGRTPPYRSWSFWLPFGLGLGGQCFRTAAAQLYLRPLNRSQSGDKENYIRLPESVPHECLITLPIDHPDLLARDLPAINPFRARQLIGVLTIGTTSQASELCSLCAVSSDEEKAVTGRILQSLRDECQATCDRIAYLMKNGL
jgi:CHAT domain